MATWQFSVNLIPKSWAIKNDYDSSLFYSDEGYDTEVAWVNNQPKPDYINSLSKILPKTKSWSKDLLCWGNEEEHDIQVCYENKIIDGIHIRLDLNQQLDNIITKLIQAAKELDCVLFFPELKTIVEANKINLDKALQSSRAALFVNDPHRFLDEL